MELDTKAPLFFSVPWMGKGLASASLAGEETHAPIIAEMDALLDEALGQYRLLKAADSPTN